MARPWRNDVRLHMPRLYVMLRRERERGKSGAHLEVSAVELGVVGSGCARDGLLDASNVLCAPSNDLAHDLPL